MVVKSLGSENARGWSEGETVNAGKPDTSSTGEQCLLSWSSRVLTGSPVSPPAALPSLFTVPAVLLYLGHASASPSRRGKTKFLFPAQRAGLFQEERTPYCSHWVWRKEALFPQSSAGTLDVQMGVCGWLLLMGLQGWAAVHDGRASGPGLRRCGLWPHGRCHSPSVLEQTVHTSGRPLPGCEVKIVSTISKVLFVDQKF